jgi:hypothetical protein
VELYAKLSGIKTQTLIVNQTPGRSLLSKPHSMENRSEHVGEVFRVLRPLKRVEESTGDWTERNKNPPLFGCMQQSLNSDFDV